jgi:sporulation protein YlmC with PRC-barrel domain
MTRRKLMARSQWLFAVRLSKEISMKKITTILVLSAATAMGAQALAQTTMPAPSTPPAATPPTTTPPATTMAPADPIYMMPATGQHWRSSDMIGKPVYSRNDERVGEIDELLMTSDGRVVAAVVGVGGFLGIGERKVALSFPAIQAVKDSNGVDRLTVGVSRDMLRSAPEYKPVKAM